MSALQLLKIVVVDEPGATAGRSAAPTAPPPAPAAPAPPPAGSTMMPAPPPAAGPGRMEVLPDGTEVPVPPHTAGPDFDAAVARRGNTLKGGEPAGPPAPPPVTPEAPAPAPTGPAPAGPAAGIGPEALDVLRTISFTAAGIRSDLRGKPDAAPSAASAADRPPPAAGPRGGLTGRLTAGIDRAASGTAAITGGSPIQGFQAVTGGLQQGLSALGSGAKLAASGVSGLGQVGGAAASGLSGLAKGAGAAGIALGVVEKAAGAISKATDAAVARGRELSYLSGTLSAAGARADAARFRGDVREAQVTGKATAALTDEQSKLQDTLRELLLPIKNVLITVLGKILNAINGILEFLKPAWEFFLKFADGILAAVEKVIRALSVNEDNALVRAVMDIRDALKAKPDAALAGFLDDLAIGARALNLVPGNPAAGAADVPFFGPLLGGLGGQ